MDETLEHHLIESARLWRSLVNRQLGQNDLSLSAWRVLDALSRDAQGCTQKVLASRLGVEGPTLVKLLDGLVRQGWIVRQPSPEDRRANTIWLTEQALPRIRQIQAELCRLRQRMLEGVGADCRQALQDALGRLHASLLARRDALMGAGETDRQAPD